MRRLCLSAAAGITYFGASTKTENQSGHCSAVIAIGSLRRHFSELLSLMYESRGLIKSTSMEIKQPFEACDCWVTKIPAGGKCKCGHADISTMWLSKTIGPSS